MQDTVQDSVQDTLQARANGKRWTLDYPELGTAPLPVTPYLSPEYFTQEREKIFTRTWLCTGKRAEEIPVCIFFADLKVHVTVLPMSTYEERMFGIGEAASIIRLYLHTGGCLSTQRHCE